MPGFHSCAGGRNQPGLLSMEVLSTIARGWVEFYRREGTISTFDFPLVDMAMFGEPVAMDYDAMEDYLSADGNLHWWLARFYGNYSNHLDAYVRWGTCPGVTYHYEFRAPDYLYVGVPVNEHGIYADPRNWYRSTSYRFIRSYTDAEYAAINTLAVDTSIPDAANVSNEPITVDETIAATDVAMVGASSIAAAGAADVAMDGAAIAVAESAATPNVGAPPIDDRATMEA